jgi:DNA polymerase elongation subunit (family B)
MFIELKGRSKDEAFKIGQDIAKSVTAMFPKPIKLKFEKVRRLQLYNNVILVKLYFIYLVKNDKGISGRVFVVQWL